MKKKSNFSSIPFFYCIVIFLSSLLLWNIFFIGSMGLNIGLITIGIQASVLILTLTKNRYAKISIMVFGALFFVLGSGLQLVGRLLQDIGYDFKNFNLFFYSRNIILIMIGFFIVITANKTIKIIS